MSLLRIAVLAFSRDHTTGTYGEDKHIRQEHGSLHNAHMEEGWHPHQPLPSVKVTFQPIAEADPATAATTTTTTATATTTTAGTEAKAASSTANGGDATHRSEAHTLGGGYKSKVVLDKEQTVGYVASPTHSLLFKFPRTSTATVALHGVEEVSKLMAGMMTGGGPNGKEKPVTKDGFLRNTNHCWPLTQELADLSSPHPSASTSTSISTSTSTSASTSVSASTSASSSMIQGLVHQEALPLSQSLSQNSDHIGSIINADSPDICLVYPILQPKNMFKAAGAGENDKSSAVYLPWSENDSVVKFTFRDERSQHSLIDSPTVRHLQLSLGDLVAMATTTCTRDRYSVHNVYIL